MIHCASNIPRVASIYLTIWLACPDSSIIVGEVQSRQYLIYQLWLSQADISTILYLDVDPKESLQVYLNGKDQVGSLEVLNDLVNLLLVSTSKYQVTSV